MGEHHASAAQDPVQHGDHGGRRQSARQTVYAAAGNKTNGGNAGTGVYKSIDCGATFTFREHRE